jgi:hypothetical protein
MIRMQGAPAHRVIDEAVDDGCDVRLGQRVARAVGYSLCGDQEADNRPQDEHRDAHVAQPENLFGRGRGCKHRE